MDATRTRRTKDQARRAYYAAHRQRRFARHMGFVSSTQRQAEARRPALAG